MPWFRDTIARIPGVADRLPPVVPLLRLEGMIAAGGNRRALNLDRLETALTRAFRMKGAAAVALQINSPGGSAAQSSLIGQRIRQLAEEAELPVIAFIEDVAASGGYWLACAADEIYADPSALVGSIGVISAGFGLDRAIERLGVERRLYTAGERKSLLDPFRPEQEIDRARLDRLLGQLHGNFIDWVKTRRGDKLKPGDEPVFEGEIWLAEDARRLGLIDGIGQADRILRERFGEKLVLLPMISKRPSLLGLLSADTRGGHAAGAGLADALLDAAMDRAHWARWGL